MNNNLTIQLGLGLKPLKLKALVRYANAIS